MPTIFGRLMPAALVVLALAASVSCQVTGNEAVAAEESGTLSRAWATSPAGPDPRPASPSATPAATPSQDDADEAYEAVRKALDALPGSSGSYSIAVKDVEAPDSVVHGATAEEFDTASIVKVDILLALLLRAQDNGTSLTTEQRQLATAMIRTSDNDAADALWMTIGGAQGLDAANERLGLTATTAGGSGHWGLTQTTAADQLALLDAVFSEESPLTSRSRDYVESLMSDVVPEQRWGISAAAGSGSTVALKNGWLPRTATGLWDVNSIGRVEYAGRTLLVAVLSDGQPSQGAGIDLVEQVATVAVEALVEASV
ncbi:serine hydrolase [Streptomyces sp. NPDC020681]|uniref:serine hydrolase n=1 Tax=Streptomyces sp. NPDC020681 TaxID=3365083 RepID=UPI00379D90FB